MIDRMVPNNKRQFAARELLPSGKGVSAYFAYTAYLTLFPAIWSIKN